MFDRTQSKPFFRLSVDTRQILAQSSTIRSKVRLREYIWWLDPDSLFVQSLGLTAMWVTIPYITRVTQAERAWEERLQEARRLKEDESGVEISDLEFYRQSAASYPSMYGPQGVIRQRQKSEKEKGEDFQQSKQQEIDAFENEFGVDYDPYYDEPYTEEELPSDLRFYTNIGYGDRIYEDGQIFFKEYVDSKDSPGKKDVVYYRRGAKPRVRKSFFAWRKDINE